MNLKLSNLRQIIEKKNYSTLKFAFLNKNKARIKQSDESIFSVSDSENEQKIFLISNKNNCHSICPSWTNNIDKSTCKLKQYSAFKNMTREFYNNLLKEKIKHMDIQIDSAGTHLRNVDKEIQSCLADARTRFEEDTKNIFGEDYVIK